MSIQTSNRASTKRTAAVAFKQNVEEQNRLKQLDEIKLEIKAVEDGSHEILLKHLNALKKRRVEQLQYADLMNKRRTENAAMLYAAEKKQTADEYKHGKELCINSMLEQLNSKRKRLLQKGATTRKRAAQADFLDATKKDISFRHIKWCVTSEQYHADLAAIKRPFISWARHDEISVEKAILRYFGSHFKEGSVIVCTMKRRNPFQGVILEVAPLWIIVKRVNDDMDIRITIADLVSSKWSLEETNT